MRRSLEFIDYDIGNKYKIDQLMAKKWVQNIYPNMEASKILNSRHNYILIFESHTSITNLLSNQSYG